MTVGIDPHALAASLRRLQERRQEAVLAESLNGVVDACTEFFDIDGSGLMLADEYSVLQYVVASDDVSQALEDRQIEIGEGPCVDAYIEDAMVDTVDVQSDERWPELGPKLAGTPVRAVLGVPVQLAGIPVGSLDVFRNRPEPFDDSERHALSRYAEVISTMLSAALRAERAGELATQLHYALDYRVPIERGIGYLMARDGLTSVQAFNQLRAASRASRRKIGDVATGLLTDRQLPYEAS